MALPCNLSCPGGGGQCDNQYSDMYADSSASFSASHTMGAVVVTPFGGGGGFSDTRASGSSDASTNSHNGQNASSCPPNVTQNSSNTNISNSLMSVNNSTLIMNSSSLSAISSSINQMVVNKLSTTTTSSTQNVEINQNISINISGVAGNVRVTNISNKADISANNAVQLDLNAIDEVRTDLANQVLQQFAQSANTDAIDSMQTSIENELKSANEAINTLDQDNKVVQEQNTNIPMASPMTIQTPVPGANVNSNLTSYNSVSNQTLITAPFTSSTDVNRSIQTSVLNAVTQNFTHETVTQLASAIAVNQNIGINISSVGGNVDIDNISNITNVVMVSTLKQHMDIGTSIANSMAGSLGVSTDDKVTTKVSKSTTLKDSTTLRSSSSSSNNTKSVFSYEQTLTQSLMPSGGSSTSCSFSSLCLIIIMVISPMIMNSLPAPDEEAAEEETPVEASPDGTSTATPPTTSTSETTTSTSETPTSTSEPPPSIPEAPAGTGGYYFF